MTYVYANKIKHAKTAWDMWLVNSKFVHNTRAIFFKKETNMQHELHLDSRM